MSNSGPGSRRESLLAIGEVAERTGKRPSSIRYYEQIGLLPQPLTHGVAAALGGHVYLIGGRGGVEGTQTAAIQAIDPLSGRVQPAGHLPVALSDVGAATIGGAVMVAGGREASGTLSREVYLLRPRAGTP